MVAASPASREEEARVYFRRRKREAARLTMEALRGPPAVNLRNRPDALALLVEEHLDEVEALRRRGDPGVAAIARGEGAGDRPLGQAAARHVGERAHQDPHHVVEEGVALDLDAEQA